MYRKSPIPITIISFLIALLFLSHPSFSEARRGSSGKSGSSSRSGGSRGGHSSSRGGHSSSRSGHRNPIKTKSGGHVRTKSGGHAYSGRGSSGKGYSGRSGGGRGKMSYGGHHKKPPSPSRNSWGRSGKGHSGKGRSGKGHGGSSSSSSKKKCFLFICWGGGGGSSSGKGSGKGNSKPSGNPFPSQTAGSGGDQDPKPDVQATLVSAEEAAAAAADPINGAAGSSTPDEDRINVTTPEDLDDSSIPVGETDEEDEEVDPEPVPMDPNTFQTGAILSDYGASGAPSVGRGREVRGGSASVDPNLASAKLSGSGINKNYAALELSAKGFQAASDREKAGTTLGAGGAGVKVSQIRAQLDKNDPNRSDKISGDGQRYIQAAQSFHQLGDDKAALRQAEAAIKADGKSSLGYLAKAKALMGLGKYKSAERFAKFGKKLARTRNTKSEALTIEAMAQQKQGRMNDAIASATMAKRYATGDQYKTNALATSAFLCEQKGDRDCVLENLRAASEIDKTYEQHYMLARSGKKVFDPNATDASALMNALTDVAKDEAPAQRSKLWFLLPGLLMLGGIGASIRAIRMRPTVADFKEELAKPVLAAAAVVPATETADRLDGKYELLKVVGNTTFGQIWEAKDHSLDRTVAIKKLALGQVADGAEGRAAFLEEARTLGALNHPSIVDVFAVLDRPDALYLVCEMLEGKTLRQILNEQGTLPLANVKRVLVDAAKGLHQAHEHGIIHRDVSPDRIVLTKQGFVKVSDFGLKKSAGAMGYRAPESRPGLQTAQCDVYALGVCLHEALIGGKPAEGASFDGIETGLAALLRDSLAADPADRLKSAAEFYERLEVLEEAAAAV